MKNAAKRRYRDGLLFVLRQHTEPSNVDKRIVSFSMSCKRELTPEYILSTTNFRAVYHDPNERYFGRRINPGYREKGAEQVYDLRIQMAYIMRLFPHAACTCLCNCFNSFESHFFNVTISAVRDYCAMVEKHYLRFFNDHREGDIDSCLDVGDQYHDQLDKLQRIGERSSLDRQDYPQCCYNFGGAEADEYVKLKN